MGGGGGGGGDGVKGMNVRQRLEQERAIAEMEWQQKMMWTSNEYYNSGSVARRTTAGMQSLKSTVLTLSQYANNVPCYFTDQQGEALYSC